MGMLWSVCLFFCLFVCLFAMFECCECTAMCSTINIPPLGATILKPADKQKTKRKRVREKKLYAREHVLSAGRLWSSARPLSVYWSGVEEGKISGKIAQNLPCLHLRICHLETFGQGGPFRRGQIFLLVKTLFQFTDLHSGEWRTWLFAFRWCPILVWVANSTCW